MAGVSFVFDPKLPGGERIIMDSVKVEGVPIDLQKVSVNQCKSIHENVTSVSSSIKLGQ